MATPSPSLPGGDLPESAYIPENILITGAAGFIASNTVHRIMRLNPDYNIVVLDKFDYCASIKNLRELQTNPKLTIVKGDIQSSDLVNHLLVSHNIDTIMHFAAQVKFVLSIPMCDVNVTMYER
jgi:UDP-glucose 4,6-dehydratase